jgi:hypothetical protein
MTQIFKITYRSLKNQEAVKNLLCDCNPNFSWESLATDDIITSEPTVEMLDIAAILNLGFFQLGWSNPKNCSWSDSCDLHYISLLIFFPLFWPYHKFRCLNIDGKIETTIVWWYGIGITKKIRPLIAFFHCSFPRLRGNDFTPLSIPPWRIYMKA